MLEFYNTDTLGKQIVTSSRKISLSAIIKTDSQTIIKCSRGSFDLFSACNREIFSYLAADLSLIKVIAVSPFVGPYAACGII